MGCDIHMFCEIKINDRWEHYCEISIPRDYKLFSRLVDKHPRNDEKYPINGIAPERGIPDDINPLTNILLCGVADHTFSWLSLEEIKQTEFLKYWKYHFFNNGASNLEIPAKNFRFVFGFDS